MNREKAFRHQSLPCIFMSIGVYITSLFHVYLLWSSDDSAVKTKLILSSDSLALSLFLGANIGELFETIKGEIPICESMNSYVFCLGTTDGCHLVILLMS